MLNSQSQLLVDSSRLRRQINGVFRMSSFSQIAEWINENSQLICDVIEQENPSRKGTLPKIDLFSFSNMRAADLITSSVIRNRPALVPESGWRGGMCFFTRGGSYSGIQIFLMNFYSMFRFFDVRATTVTRAKHCYDDGDVRVASFATCHADYPNMAVYHALAGEIT